MWTFSNILAGSHQQIEHILSRPKLLKSIINAVNTDNVSVSKEAAWCICNATADATASQRKVLVEAGAIESLCYLLNKPQFVHKEENITMILEALESFLGLYEKMTYNPYAIQVEECHGLDALERINADETISEELYEKITQIIKRYWDTEICHDNNNNNNKRNQYVLEDKLNANIDTNTNQFTFGFNAHDNGINSG
eukprot:399132_1